MAYFPSPSNQLQVLSMLTLSLSLSLSSTQISSLMAQSVSLPLPRAMLDLLDRHYRVCVTVGACLQVLNSAIGDSASIPLAETGEQLLHLILSNLFFVNATYCTSILPSCPPLHLLTASASQWQYANFVLPYLSFPSIPSDMLSLRSTQKDLDLVSQRVTTAVPSAEVRTYATTLQPSKHHAQQIIIFFCDFFLWF